ncbi:MAG TPA: hypothetical protein VL986_06925 [Terracidiphilus sp.]|nr:hypothetical protein [Terracidiphilus sp.]
MDKLVPLMQAAAPLAWVVFAFVALFMFKREITLALLRLRKGKFLGQEFELGEELASLQTSATVLALEAQEIPLEDRAAASQEDGFDAKIRPILQEAAKSPKVAIMMLRAELERQAMHGLATRGLLRGGPAVSVREALSELRQYGFPANLEGSLDQFNSVGNKIIHGVGASDDDALRALDSGMTILRVLSALPLETHTVYHPGVDIFSDSSCTKPIPNAKGVILEVTSPGGVMKRMAIFPTTCDHFKKGKKVAWEWSSGKRWDAAWYRDPDTNEIKSAWGASAEFVGRHLDDILGSTESESGQRQRG